MNELTTKQKAILNQLSYLGWNEDINTVSEWVNYWEDELKKNDVKKYEQFEAFFIEVKKDQDLQDIKIQTFIQDNLTGFEAYIFETLSGDSVISFRGSNDWKDWIGNALLLLTGSHPQEKNVISLLESLEYENISTTGHSLGGYNSNFAALTSEKVARSTPFNAVGPLNPIKNLLFLLSGNQNKVNGFRSSGDAVSLTDMLFNPTTLDGKDIDFFNFTGGHSMENILKGIETMDTDINPFGSLIESFATLTGKNDELRESFINAWSEIQENSSELLGGVATSFNENLPPLIENISTSFSELPGNVGGFFNQITTGLSTWNSDMIIKNEEEMPNFIESVKASLSELPGNVGEFFDQITTGLSTWTSDMIIKSEEEMPSFISQVTTFFSQLPGNMLPIGDDMVKGIFNGISNSIQWLYGMLKGWVSNVISYIKNLFGIHSPSAIMRDEVGKNLALGVAEGITKNTDAVSDAMSEMADVVSDSDISVEPETSAKSIDFEAFKEKIRPSLDFVKSQISKAQDVLNTQFAASMQLASAMAGANNTYNNGKWKRNLESILIRYLLRVCQEGYLLLS